MFKGVAEHNKATREVQGVSQAKRIVIVASPLKSWDEKSYDDYQRVMNSHQYVIPVF